MGLNAKQQSAIDSMNAFRKKLLSLPTAGTVKVTEKAAPKLTELGQRSYEEHRSPEGRPWQRSVTGEHVTLVDTGLLRKFLKYFGVGRKLRVRLPVPYAKYQIGKRPVFPQAGLPLPQGYKDVLSDVVSEVFKDHFKE